jgi:hypothetical protein
MFTLQIWENKFQKFSEVTLSEKFKAQPLKNNILVPE